MNLPNKLTIFRIILVPIMVAFTYIPLNMQILGIDLNMWIIDIIFIVASITDTFDGILARKNNQITTFGKFLDPLADKILVLSAMIMLVELEKIPSWIPIIIIIREFAVSGYRLVVTQKSGEVIAANMWGKVKTVTQMVGVPFMFLSNYTYFAFLNMKMSHSIDLELLQYGINSIGSIMITVSVIATIVSGYIYLKNAKQLLKD